jgi:hypothetical protein
LNQPLLNQPLERLAMNHPKPSRLTAADFHPEVLKLFDQYVHGALDRRGFLDKSSRFAAMSGTTAAGLLAALSPDFAYGQKVPPTDARIKTERVEIASPLGHGKINALGLDAREPGSEPAHRRHRTTARGGQLHRRRA